MYQIFRSRFSVFFVLLFFFLVFCLSAKGEQEPPQDEVLEAPEEEPAGVLGSSFGSEEAAKVNGTVIAVEDVERQILRFQQRYQSQGLSLTEEQMGMARRQVLEGLIDRRLMSSAAAAAGYSADPDQVEEKFAQFKGQFSGEEELNNVLTEQGLTLEIIHADIEEFLAIQDFLEKEIYETIEVTEEEALNFYDENPGIFDQPEEVRASHILLTLDPEADEAVRGEVEGRMKAIQEKIAAGEDFAALAVEFSEGPSGPRGGDLGFFGRGAMVPEFETVAFALEAGKVSDVVESPYGLHLIKLMERKEAETPGFEESKDQITDSLTEQKGQEAITAFLADKKEAAQIEILMELPPIPEEPEAP